MPSTMEMSPVQIAARVAVMWEERDSGAGGDLWEQLLSGSLDPERGALPAGETYETVFEERGISLFQSIWGGVVGERTGQGGYPLVDQLLANTTVALANPTAPRAETLMSSIAHLLTDIRAVLGDGDAALTDIGITVGDVASTDTPYRYVDLTRPSTIRERLLPHPDRELGPRSVASSIQTLAAAISDLDGRVELACSLIRDALGENSTVSEEAVDPDGNVVVIERERDITRPVVFSPALPRIRGGPGQPDEAETVAAAFQALEERFEERLTTVAVALRRALGADEPERIDRDITFSPILPRSQTHAGAATVASAFRDVHEERLRQIERDIQTIWRQVENG